MFPGLSLDIDILDTSLLAGRLWLVHSWPKPFISIRRPVTGIAPCSRLPLKPRRDDPGLQQRLIRRVFTSRNTFQATPSPAYRPISAYTTALALAAASSTPTFSSTKS